MSLGDAGLPACVFLSLWGVVASPPSAPTYSGRPAATHKGPCTSSKWPHFLLTETAVSATHYHTWAHRPLSAVEGESCVSGLTRAGQPVFLACHTSLGHDC